MTAHSLRLSFSLVLVLGALAASASVGCSAPIHEVAYVPQPARVADPGTEVRSIILANTVQGCVTEPELSASMLVVKFVCTGAYAGGVGNRVVRFDKVAGISLQESGGWYRVLVKHADGTADFDWTSKSLADMQRLADALAALSPHAGSPPRAPATDV